MEIPRLFEHRNGHPPPPAARRPRPRLPPGPSICLVSLRPPFRISVKTTPHRRQNGPQAHPSAAAEEAEGPPAQQGRGEPLHRRHVFGSGYAMRLPLQRPSLSVSDTNELTNSFLSKTACWASAGYNSAGCATVENALRACMDTPKPAPKASNTINYHLQRFHERLTQGKRKK